jgi:hypothetical protein
MHQVIHLNSDNTWFNIRSWRIHAQKFKRKKKFRGVNSKKTQLSSILIIFSLSTLKDSCLIDVEPTTDEESVIVLLLAPLEERRGDNLLHSNPAGDFTFSPLGCLDDIILIV